MIKKIHHIKNLGIFENYRWDNTLPEFKDRNIIYGWNYSGKTTLSRLISYLDKEKPIDSDYNNLDFDVELDDGTHITHNNRNLYSCKIKVFNSDFIKDNLHFDSNEQQIAGIKFAVGEVGIIQTQIKDLEKYIEKAVRIRDSHQVYTHQYETIVRGYTDIARQLTEILSLGRTFNRASVSSVINSYGESSLKEYILSPAEEERVRITATSQNAGSIINLTEIPNPNFLYLLDKVRMISKRVPAPFKDDELLSSDGDLYAWGKTGWKLYQQRPQLTKCAFCGGVISKEGRLKELNTYYTNEAAILKSDIEQIKQEIISEKQVFASLTWAIKSDNDVALAYRQLYSEKKQKYQQIRANYFLLLDVLIEKLEDKYNSSLFLAKEITDIDESAYLKLNNWIAEVKKIFEDSNSTINSYSEIQTKAKEQYINHYIAKYLKEHQYSDVVFLKSREEYWCGILNDSIVEKEKEIKTLNDKLNSIDKGKDEINIFIKRFLNREDLSIEVTDDQFFVLKRDGRIAKHLSDGEKTAIAFSHFMVLLKSLKDDNKLKDYIIFIDDPISSLDANHIAQIYSLIISFFYQKGLDPSDPNKICSCTQQLFIATHNFEFFSYVNKASLFAKAKTSRYCIKRISKNVSSITIMPKCYYIYNSEYVYLFSEINKAKIIKDSLTAGSLFPEDDFYTLPNIIRRFLEIYTLIKLPGSKGEIDERIKTLIGDTRELKILHDFSHFTSFERVTKHNELLSRIPDILDDVFTLLNKDPEHLKSLKEGIQE